MFSSLKSSGTLLGTLPLNKVVIEQGAAKVEIKKSNSDYQTISIIFMTSEQ